MSLEERLLAVNRLAVAIKSILKDDKGIFTSVYHANPWFTLEHTQRMLKGILFQYLAEHHLVNWLSIYRPFVTRKHSSVLGIVMAGNIPMVGFHDLLCGLVSGYQIKVKLSDKDAILIPYLLKQAAIPSDIVECVDKLPKCHKVIATGSNNSSRYFEYYFRDIPHVIRKNRTSVAILDGSESPEQLQLLGDDMLSYFGLGCRNISTVFVPHNYDIDQLFEAVISHSAYQHHNKYFNNFEYTSALYLLNKEEFKSNGYFIVRESDELFARISTVHIQRYETYEEVTHFCKVNDENIQCVSTGISDIDHTRKVSLGQCQSPSLTDYADGIDTMDFLMSN